MRCTRDRTCPSTCRARTPTSWSARPTSSTARTWASCGAVASCWRACRAYKVRPAGDDLPSRFETGTPAQELLAGSARHVRATWSGSASTRAGRRASPAQRTVAAGCGFAPPGCVTCLRARPGAQADRGRSSAVPGVRIRGITDPARVDERCPTIAFTLDGHHPRDVASVSRAIARSRSGTATTTPGS